MKSQYQKDQLGYSTMKTKQNIDKKIVNNSEIFKIIQISEKALQYQRKTSFKQKILCIARLSFLIQKNERLLLNSIQSQSLRSKQQILIEIQRSREICKDYILNINCQKYQQMLQNKIQQIGKIIQYNPSGIFYNILSSKLPLYQNFKKTIPCLLAGNSIIIQYPQNYREIGELVENLFKKAGFYRGEYQTFYHSQSYYKYMLTHKSIRCVIYAGCRQQGVNVISIAIKIKKCYMISIGYNDPFVVFPDANLENAVKHTIQVLFDNYGLQFYLPKRFIIVSDVYQIFKEKLIKQIEKLKQTEQGNYQDNNLRKKYRNHCRFIISQKSFQQIPLKYKQFGFIIQLYCARNQHHAIQLANEQMNIRNAYLFSENNGLLISNIKSHYKYINTIIKKNDIFSGTQQIGEFLEKTIYISN